MEPQILICFDEAQSGPRVLNAGKRLSRLLKMKMVVIHVRERTGGVSGYYDELFHDNLQRIDELFGGQDQEDLLFVKTFFNDGKRLPRFKLVTGNPSELILQELSSGDYGLVLIGTKNGREAGATGRAVIAGSPIDVYVVKG
jgi:nucleotide-binding universal stress UspA family protein